MPVEAGCRRRRRRRGFVTPGGFENLRDPGYSCWAATIIIAQAMAAFLWPERAGGSAAGDIDEAMYPKQGIPMTVTTLIQL